MRGFLGILSLFIFCFSLVESGEPQKTVNIALISDSDSAGLLRTREIITREISDLLTPEFNVQFSDLDNYNGHWNQSDIQQSVDKAFNDPAIDIVVGLGVMTSNELAQRKTLPKPAFAPFIMNIDLQGLSYDDGITNVDNLNYLTFPTNLERDFLVFHEMAPFKKATVLVNGFVLQVIPNLAKTIKNYGKEAGVDVEILPVWTSADDALHRLPKDTDAVYILSLTQLSDDENIKLADGLIKRKIPSFTLFRQKYLDHGYLASMSADSDIPRLVRRLALNIQRTLLGENARQLPVDVPADDQLTVNMATADALGLKPPWMMLRNAVLINPEGYNIGHEMDIVETVKYGLSQNFDLAASCHQLKAGKEEVNKARSSLLPQVYVGGAYTTIDKDRAEGTFGVWPQHGVWARAGASQMIYSNELIGGVKVQRHLQKARQHGYAGFELDVTLTIGESYLNLLRAQTLEKIQRNNLNKTRSHLKLARQRVDVGIANSSEVYRWESQYANDLSSVTDAHYQAKVSETSMKRLINYPQEEKIIVKELTLDESYWVGKKRWLEDNVTNDKNLELFVDYSIIEGLAKAEDLKKIRQEICAQAEVLGISKRAFWAPEIFLDAYGQDRTNEWGAGSKEKSIFNGTDWIVGVNVTFPLYTGGYKNARKRQACEELKKLKYHYESIASAKREEIRNSVYKAISSYTAISLSHDSAKSAEQNLLLVQDAYRKGVMSIVDLLDAQNQALIANMVTANAIYDFLIDLLNFQRGVGRFDFLTDPDDISDWIDNIDKYFKIRLGD